MDAIKKKMQAMKIEKDNVMDRADMSERACKVKYQPGVQGIFLNGLCLLEKYCILHKPEYATLNSRDEFFSPCRHKWIHVLKNG